MGANASATLDNLIAAINKAAGEGTTYGPGTVAHPNFTAAAGDGDTMVITAKVIGAAWNGKATTDTEPGAETNIAWGAATTSGGKDATIAKTGKSFIDTANSLLYICIADTDGTEDVLDDNWMTATLTAIST